MFRGADRVVVKKRDDNQTNEGDAWDLAAG
jgi:hypothetical protein